jgi:hypothetical protein
MRWPLSFIIVSSIVASYFFYFTKREFTYQFSFLSLLTVSMFLSGCLYMDRSLFAVVDSKSNICSYERKFLFKLQWFETVWWSWVIPVFVSDNCSLEIELIGSISDIPQLHPSPKLPSLKYKRNNQDYPNGLRRGNGATFDRLFLKLYWIRKFHSDPKR